MDTIISSLSAAKQYRDAWAEGRVDRTISTRQDIGAPLTGGGLTLDAVCAIQEYVRHCVATETGRDPKPAWRGAWQETFVNHIADNTYSAIQAPRRLGKSYCAGLWMTAAILAGMTAILALPTLLQGKRLIMHDVQVNLKRLAVLFPELQVIRAKTFNTGEVEYSFGGRAIVLSADEGAEKEGYGCDLLILDEAHKAPQSAIGIFQPFTDDAITEGHGRVVMLGIGEQKHSALELAKQGGVKAGDLGVVEYNVLTMKDEQLVKAYPQLKQTFDNARATLPATGPGGYPQNYSMSPVRPGSGQIFKTPIPAQAEYVIGVNERMYFGGWDPGKRQDDSLVTILEVGPSVRPQERAYNVVDYLQLPPGMDYPDQIRTIVAWLKQKHPTVTPARFTVEDNGVGDAAADCLRDEWSANVNSFFTSDYYNDFYVGEMQICAQQGRLGIADEDYRVEVNGLTYTINEKNNVQYEHSDKLASLKAAMFGAYFNS